MTDESTRLINEEPTRNCGAYNSAANPVNNPMYEPAPKGKSATGKIVAGTAGGFVAGAAVGVAATAFTADGNTVPETATTAAENVTVPAEEQAILANDEGIRYAHVDAVSFDEAFAQARAQVGAGGVFEYNGRLYGTYYADEWNSMSAQERADYQSRVGETAPVTHHSHVTHHSPVATAHGTTVADNSDITHTEDTAHTETHENVAPDAQMIAAEPVDNEIHVLGVETVNAPDGSTLNVALVAAHDDHALLVDVDNDGKMDVLWHDDNADSQIQEQELHDISQHEIALTDLQQAAAAEQGDYLCATDDDMPDYINDGDPTFLV